MFESLILIAGFVFIALDDPALATVLSLITSLSVSLAGILDWGPVAHDTQAAVHLAQFV